MQDKEQAIEIRLYGLQEIAEALNVTRRTLYNYLKQGKLKAVKIGKEWRVSEDNLHRFLNGE